MKIPKILKVVSPGVTVSMKILNVKRSFFGALGADLTYPGSVFEISAYCLPRPRPRPSTLSGAPQLLDQPCFAIRCSTVCVSSLCNFSGAPHSCLRHHTGCAFPGTLFATALFQQPTCVWFHAGTASRAWSRNQRCSDSRRLMESLTVPGRNDAPVLMRPYVEGQWS